MQYISEHTKQGLIDKKKYRILQNRSMNGYINFNLYMSSSWQ